jgi:hypothetical protein
LFDSPESPVAPNYATFCIAQEIAVHKIVSLLAGTWGFSEFIGDGQQCSFLRCNKRKNEADEFLHHDNRLRNSFGVIA